LAGGPLIIAILVSRLGRIGPLVWHMPQSANHAFRELGIALFFAALDEGEAAHALLQSLARVTAERKDTSRDPRMAILDRIRELGAPDGARSASPSRSIPFA
jgi:hypothetical protein